MGGPRQRGLGSRWAPFMFPFWAPGSDGWAAATGLGFRWAPFMFPFCSWAGWVGPGQEAGLPLSSLRVSFLGSCIGWVSRAEKLGSRWAPFMFPFWAPGSGWVFVGLPWAPGSDGWAPAKRLGSHCTPFILPFWAAGSDGWAAANELGSH